MRRLHAQVRTLLLAVLASAGAAGCLSPEAVRKIEEGPEGTGIMFSRLPAVIRILATYEATPAQQAQARETVSRLQAELAAKPAVAGEAAVPVVAEAPAPSAAVMPAATLPAYIAVPVAPDERRQGESQVMIWDTRAADFIDNNVYDAATTPEEGVEMRWETRSATLAVVYLGAGRAPVLPGS